MHTACRGTAARFDRKEVARKVTSSCRRSFHATAVLNAMGPIRRVSNRLRYAFAYYLQGGLKLTSGTAR
jgi:hypothetical protein